MVLKLTPIYLVVLFPDKIGLCIKAHFRDFAVMSCPKWYIVLLLLGDKEKVLKDKVDELREEKEEEYDVEAARRERYQHQVQACNEWKQEHPDKKKGVGTPGVSMQ